MAPNLTRPPIGFIEIADTNLVFHAVSVSDVTLTGSQILAYADVSPRQDYVVLHWQTTGDVEEVRPDEVVEIIPSTPARFIISKSDRLFRLVLDSHSLLWPNRKINESALRRLGQVDQDAELYLEKENVPDVKLERGQSVSLADAGVEKIYSKKSAWKLNVQGVVVESNDPNIQVRKALLDAGFNPDQGWIIVLKTADSKRPIGLDEIIDLRAPGIEKLRLTPRDVNNGEAAERRLDFKLLAVDDKGLGSRSLKWQCVVDGGHRWLILDDYPVPPGFSTSNVTLALDVPPTYPSAEIDMFYCSPHLSRANGSTIPQTEARVTIGGRSFQRWSRHRGPGSRWNPSVDNVLSHLALVDSALLREIEK